MCGKQVTCQLMELFIGLKKCLEILSVKSRELQPLEREEVDYGVSPWGWKDGGDYVSQINAEELSSIELAGSESTDTHTHRLAYGIDFSFLRQQYCEVLHVICISITMLTNNQIKYHYNKFISTIV